MKLVIKVYEIKGRCPVYHSGDEFFIEDGYILKPSVSGGICMHSLTSLTPYYVALSKGVKPKDLGLTKENNKAYVQCLDPCEYTGGGTVIFQIEKVES